MTRPHERSPGRVDVDATVVDAGAQGAPCAPAQRAHREPRDTGVESDDPVAASGLQGTPGDPTPRAHLEPRDACLEDAALLLAADLQGARLSAAEHAHLESCEACLSRLAERALENCRVDEAVRRAHTRPARRIALGLTLAAVFALPAYARDVLGPSFADELSSIARATSSSLHAVTALSAERTWVFAALGLGLAAFTSITLLPMRRSSL